MVAGSGNLPDRKSKSTKKAKEDELRRKAKEKAEELKRKQKKKKAKK